MVETIFHPMQDQQTRGLPVLSRVLRDEFIGEVKVEIGRPHGVNIARR